MNWLKESIQLPFGGRKNSEASQTGTTASSTTDITSQAGWVDPEKAEAAANMQAASAKPETVAADDEKTTTKRQWPLWMKLAIAGCIFAVVVGLSVGLGVGLTRHKHNGSPGGDSSSSSGDSSSGSGSSGGSPQRPSKLAVYWGSKFNTIPLDDVCEDPSYDIVNLAFLSYFFGNGQYPRLAIPSLNGSSEAQRLAGAVDLQDGTALVPAIKKCQANGKLVLLSMGGAAGYSDVSVGSDGTGQLVADLIWNLFLGGGKKPEIRPFGNVVLDGVDFDNESGQSTGYEAMAQHFRSHFASDPSKQYYMTAAPQCPFTADDEELSLFQHLDYVSVQFYNNNVCNVGQSGFETSVRRWSEAIGNTTLLVGALASNADKDEGYVDAKTFNSVLGKVKAMNLPNYGGVMLWEAELAAKNGNYQKKIKAEL
ncbi:hypothetical protein PWT90_01329 [Aphanocladium album]|nr:hypothetical protein PWT90_01329 [Aphanocladium album]